MINVVNLNKKRKIDAKRIKKIAKYIIKKLKVKKKKLNIVFVKDSYIKKLNRIYRHKNFSTDVLCFSMPDEADIFISSDKAMANLKRFGTDFKTEIYLYVIHGILHALGFRDDTKTGRKKMEMAQKKILAEVV